MCVGVPGQVIEIEGSQAKINFQGNVLTINMGLVDAKLGDYVLVHAGCALEVLNKDSAQELLELWDELEDAVNET